MKNLFFKDNKIFTIIIFSVIFLYIFIVSYFVIWNQKIDYYFYEFNLACLSLCTGFATLTINLFDKKRENKPIKNIFKIKNDKSLSIKLFSTFIVFLMIIALFPKYTPYAFWSLIFIIMLISSLFKIIKIKTSDIELNYNENCLYINSEKILFSDIKEYSVIFKDFMHKYEIFLKDERIIHCTTFTEDVRNFEKSLFRNLRYLKINEKN